jgi:hypothetical protein
MFDYAHYQSNGYKSQIGGGKCSICKSEGATKTTCPCNPLAKNKNFEKHVNWKTICPDVKQGIKKTAKIIINEPIITKSKIIKNKSPLKKKPEIIKKPITKREIEKEKEIKKEPVIIEKPITNREIEKEIKKELVISEEPITKKEIEKEIKEGKALWQTQEFCDWVMNEKTALEPSVCYPDWPAQGNFIFTKAQAKYYASIYDPSITLNSTDIKVCKIIKKYSPDKEWFLAQENYSNHLSGVEKNAFYYYSKYGDEIINNLLRGDTDKALELLKNLNDDHKYVFSELMLEVLSFEEDTSQAGKGVRDLYNIEKETVQENEFKTDQELNDYIKHQMKLEINIKDWKKDKIIYALKHTAKRLNEVIKNAPKFTKDVYVYRGVKSIDYLQQCEIVKGFVSTSLDFSVALGFAEQNKTPNDISTVIRILVPQGTPGFLASYTSAFGYGENEIIFPHNSKLCIEDCVENVPVKLFNISSECSDEKIDIRICNATIKV